jgi:transglutaminase-like putative cysteine protease
MTRRLLAAAPLLIATLALGQASAWTLALSIALSIALVFGMGARFEVDTGRQLLSSAIGAGAGYVLSSFIYEPEPGRLGDGWAKLSAAALLGAVARALLVSPRGGYAGTLALAFAALSFAGKTQNAAYTAQVVLFLASGVWALAEPARSAPLAPRARRFGIGAGVLAVAATLGVGTSVGLRQLHAWAQGRNRFSTHAWQPRVGFSDRMDLGALDGLLDSDRRVLRVRGGRADYLRGVVLDVYEGGRWLRSEAAEQEMSARLDAPSGPGAIEIGATSERIDRFFVPLEAEQLATTPGAVRMDDIGTIHPQAKREPAESVRFVLGAASAARLATPRPSDLHLSRRMQRRLEPLARRWTADATTDADKLRAIEGHLMSDFHYARSFDRSENFDPVIDFLFSQPAGHCEYFASALALLGRAVGVPTRLVMGYRVTEHSPFGYYVVRERNAHSWVEAWLPGLGWTTHDATPAEAQPNNRQSEAGYVGSSLDALGVAYDDLSAWFTRRTLLETSLAWLAGCIVLAAIVARGARRRAARPSLPTKRCSPSCSRCSTRSIEEVTLAAPTSRSSASPPACPTPRPRVCCAATAPCATAASAIAKPWPVTSRPRSKRSSGRSDEKRRRAATATPVRAQNASVPRARRSSGTSAAYRKEFTGVATPSSAPSRTTAPVRLSSSEGRPAAMSRCRDAVPSAGTTESMIARMVASASGASPIPRARASRSISSKAPTIRRRDSGTLRTTPIGARVTAPTPAQAVMKRNFSQSES